MRIAIVNDLGMAVEILRRVVESIGNCTVTWIARDGAEAIERCRESLPDLILMDLIMPNVDGVEATRRIMAETPCPILVVTASVTGNSDRVYEAMGYGALDVVATPSLGAGGGFTGAADLIQKVRQIGLISGQPDRKTSMALTSPLAAQDKASAQPPLLAVGASTGGPNALATLLTGLPVGFPAATVLIQHVDEQFASGLASWLDRVVLLDVQVAREGERPEAGKVYVAATNDHLRLAGGGAFSYSDQPREEAYRPSVDVFFQSILKAWTAPVVGVLLTGMGDDGAAGLLALSQAGHHTIAQDQGSSVVYGMPKAAAAMKAAVEILPIADIAAAVLRRTAKK